MIRVGDLEASKKFYCEALGMKTLREKEYPDGKFTLCFVGYGDETEQAVIELTYNWGVTSYAIGDGFGHLAIGTSDIKLSGPLTAPQFLLLQRKDTHIFIYGRVRYLDIFDIPRETLFCLIVPDINSDGMSEACSNDWNKAG